MGLAIGWQMKTKTFLFMLLMILASLSACVSPTAQPTVQTLPTATPSALAAIDLGTIGHGWAKTAAWSADGKTLAVASSQGIYLYDTVTWQTFKSIPLQDDEYSNGVTQLWFSSDEQSPVYTYVSSPQLSMYRYSLTNDPITRLYSEILFSESTTFVFSADGTIFANISVTVLDEDGKPEIQPQVEIREVVSGNIVQTLNTDMEWWGRFNHALAAFSPDGTLFATGSVDNSVQVWDVETGTLLFKQNHEANVESITFNPDGKMLALEESDDAVVRLLDISSVSNLAVSLPAMTATPLPTHTTTPSPTPAIAEEIPLPLITPRPIQPNAITVNNVDKLSQTGTLGGSKYISDPHTAAWSEDGKFFAIGTLGAVYVYRTGSNSLWRSFASGKLIEGLVFSPDRRFLVEQNRDNEVILWDLIEGQRVHTFEKNCWKAQIVFSADTSTITIAPVR